MLTWLLWKVLMGGVHVCVCMCVCACTLTACEHGRVDDTNSREACQHNTTQQILNVQYFFNIFLYCILQFCGIMSI